MKINVGFLVAYDYELLKISIPLIYENATKIVLALDENFQTWSGNYFKVEDSFFEWIEQIDINKKIIIYKEDFYVPKNTAMQNEVRERNMLAKEMGEGFCIQLDADEFVLDFKAMVVFLNKHEKKLSGTKKYQICAYWNNIYKKTENGFLFVKEVPPFYMGTNQPDYVRGRKNKNHQKWCIPFAVVHLSWGRSSEELKFKLENWGHNTDFDTIKFFDFWNSINKNNYKDHQYFHPLNSKSWKELHYLEGKNITDIIKLNNFQELIPKTKRKLKNLAQTFKHLF